MTFDSPPAASPGYDATTAYIPLKGGQLVAVNLDRGTIRWRLEVATALTPSTGEGLVFTVSDQTIEARDAQTGALRWRTPLPGGAAVPLFYDTGWLLASTTSGDLVALRASDGSLLWRRQLGSPLSGRRGPRSIVCISRSKTTGSCRCCSPAATRCGSAPCPRA